MDIDKRRSEILKMLKNSGYAIKGIDIANRFNVTRQVVVKDMAVIKALDKNIVSTSDGYLYLKSLGVSKRVFLVNHDKERTKEELGIILKYGGIIEDIIIEHPIYGEIKANLYLKTLNDLENFMKKFEDLKATPLSLLTGGEHMHTVSTYDEEALDSIENELKKKGLLGE